MALIDDPSEAEVGQHSTILERISHQIEDLTEALTKPPTERMLLRLDDLVTSIRVDRRTIERERSAGRFPQPDVRLGKAPLWRPETVRAWIERGGRV